MLTYFFYFLIFLFFKIVVRLTEGYIWTGNISNKVITLIYNIIRLHYNNITKTWEISKLNLWVINWVSDCRVNNLNKRLDDTKEVIRSRTSKKKGQIDNDLQNTTQKTKDRVTRTPLKTGDELRCSGWFGRSYSTKGTRRATPRSWHQYNEDNKL